MAMVAHDPKAAKRVGIPQSVGRDYVEADKGRKFGDSKMKTKKYAAGGAMTDEERYGKVGAEIRRLDPEAFKNRPRSAEGNMALLKQLRAKAGATTDVMADSRAGTSKFREDLGRAQQEAAANAPRADAAGFGAAMRKAQADAAATRTPRADAAGFGAAMRRAQEEKPFGMKKGGNVYRRAADGIASKGKTKGTEIRMARGGSVSSASKRADGIATKGKTKGKMIAMNKGGSCY